MYTAAHAYIAIEGNIGAGKTALARLLSADLQARLILEEFEDNSFLPLFYQDPRRYAFPLEMSFVASRFSQLKGHLLDADLFQAGIVSDYMFEKSLLFARINLGDDEYELYTRLFTIIHQQLRKPDLLVYLHQPVEKLQWNISNRGRSYEQYITGEYLEQLNTHYQQYLQLHPQLRILLIDCSGIDFVHNADHYSNVRSLICKSYTPGLHYVNWLIAD